MTCEQFGELVTAFSLGELDRGSADACRAHLAGCMRCTNLALSDHQLVSRLRAAAVPAPAAVHHAVTVALRQASREHQRRRRPLWAAVTGLAAAAAVVLAFTVLDLGPASHEQEQTPLTAAWSSYSDGDLKLDPTVEVPAPLLTLPLPDLTEFELFPVYNGSLRLAGTPALATDYRGPNGERFTVFRWEGQLPGLYQHSSDAGPPNVITSTWGGITSSWWEYNGVVFCSIGNLPRPELDAAVDHLRERLLSDAA